MERRQFLKAGAIAGTAAAATTLAAPAISQGMKEFQMVTSWPKNFPGLGTAAARFAERITTMSEGKMTVKLFAGGELVQSVEVSRCGSGRHCRHVSFGGILLSRQSAWTFIFRCRSFRLDSGRNECLDSSRGRTTDLG